MNPNLILVKTLYLDRIQCFVIKDMVQASTFITGMIVLEEVFIRMHNGPPLFELHETSNPRKISFPFTSIYSFEEYTPVEKEPTPNCPSDASRLYKI